MYGVTAGDFVGYATAAGDVNGDGYDDIIIQDRLCRSEWNHNAGQSYIVYGRPSFGASLELAGLLAANGGDGSAGYALNGFVASAGSDSPLSPRLATSTATASPTCVLRTTLR